MKFTRRRKCSDFTNPKPTCYTKGQLIEFANDWNKQNKDNKIKNIRSLNKTKLWLELRKRHKTVHEDQWSKKTRKSNSRFAPKVPNEWNKNPNSWLSDDDISQAMVRYKKKFPKFHFLEPAPIDFDVKDYSGRCAYSNLCNYTYPGLAKKYNSFGAIFNTDPHDKSGQHWIALYVDLKNGEISYFDSVSDPPPKEVKKLIERFKREGEIHLKDKTISVNYNKTRHQLGNTECGVYCLAFIHHMIINGDFDAFAQERVPDNKIVKLRSYFFDDVTGLYD